MPTPSPDPETVQWVYDYIPHYRLNPTIITEYLQTKWPDYDEFLVERVGGQYRFWVPRKLKQNEQDALLEKRLPVG